MSGVCGYLQCSCSALFPTSDELDAHIEEQKSLKAALEKSKANLFAALERCSVHSAAKLENNQGDNQDLETTKGRHCPYSGCARTEAFSKRKELRIHFRKHVECNEVCQCCAYRFRLASKFLRHTPDVIDMDDSQAAYTTQRRDVIIKRVDDELRLAENRKRTREATDEYTKTFKRAKLTEVDHAATGFQHDALTDVPRSTTSLATAQSVDEPLNVGELTTQWTEAEGAFAALEPMPNLTAYNAPVHSQINWLAWIHQAVDHCET